MGEPGGVGPEVILKAIADPEIRGLGRLVVVGDRSVFEQTADLLNLSFDVPATPADTSREGLPGISFMQATDETLAQITVGKPTVAGGKASAESVVHAIALALAGTVNAIVTAPISKVAIHAAGFDFAGHTELLAYYTKAKRSVMMMAGGGIRAALVTTHMALADVPARLTVELIVETIEITNASLKRYFGIAKPHIGVCGLNPHSGEGGIFGTEEGEVIVPAIDAAKNQGIDCSGPVPADAGFFLARHGKYDALIAMYHDQGNIPVKLLAFETGVNVTLGLPIIRTSPDHGTAYDIAGSGEANPSSFKCAARMAAEMARRQ